MDFLRGPTYTKGGNGGDATIVYISIKEVVRMTSLSRSTIYRLIKKGDFPKPRQLSSGRVGFILQEVIQWMRERGKQ